MHPLNPYLAKKPDFAHLASLHPSFKPYVTVSPDGYASIDFQDPTALRALTRALLKEDWGYDVELREDRLCPTLTSYRLDYLYHILDIEPYLSSSDASSPESSASGSRPLRVLDIGTGHIAIYPLLLRHLRPTARIIATELDAVSFHHAVKTRLYNEILPASISILRPSPDQPILFPIFDGLANSYSTSREAGEGDSSSKEADKWDFVICNPPFFGSEDEMREGREAKQKGAPAAPTASDNELITPGGEVQFVGQMIRESLQLREACQWYTSLIGKYSSLMTLVEQLKGAKIDNYFIHSIKQSRTTRWILGWSFGSIRLPDSITRVDLIPGTSFAKLLAPPNSFGLTPEPPLSTEILRDRIEGILRDVQLFPPIPSSTACAQSAAETEDTPSTGAQSTAADNANVIAIAPISNTWSRAARRQAARGGGSGSAAPSQPSGSGASAQPLFRATIHFLDVRALPPPKPAVELRWLEGRDRSVVEGLWKFILTKAGLVGGTSKGAS
ncbi:uncharacterized protein MKK02DRAFT_22258 [Dioszegia hungarica]|uniref:U6 small nuclear RNA (adenine-(43)-N(6))-methyltransferase n=1 Tax=Dioszegia hungarica TaxID=4972 RepID=A0AA38LXC0_9TREE|nr:uncharacterized protein MKK02DRAFT_22258 [Dioszegia hungarica]KAI9638368.1 hypothetical protein MKK02DRAFT_22258 [Dioszegia hungarica]